MTIMNFFGKVGVLASHPIPRLNQQNHQHQTIQHTTIFNGPIGNHVESTTVSVSRPPVREASDELKERIRLAEGASKLSFTREQARTYFLSAVDEYERLVEEGIKVPEPIISQMQTLENKLFPEL